MVKLDGIEVVTMKGCSQKEKAVEAVGRSIEILHNHLVLLLRCMKR